MHVYILYIYIYMYMYDYVCIHKHIPVFFRWFFQLYTSISISQPPLKPGAQRLAEVAAEVIVRSEITTMISTNGAERDYHPVDDYGGLYHEDNDNNNDENDNDNDNN